MELFLWPRYKGEKGKTWGKSYGIKLRIICDKSAHVKSGSCVVRYISNGKLLFWGGGDITFMLFNKTGLFKILHECQGMSYKLSSKSITNQTSTSMSLSYDAHCVHL